MEQQLFRFAALAQRAAELLPGPPPSHDAFGYLAWEELVLSTACRMRAAVGSLMPDLLRLCDTPRQMSGMIGWQDLIRIAGGTLVADASSLSSGAISVEDRPVHVKSDYCHLRRPGPTAGARFVTSIPSTNRPSHRLSTGTG